jgi:hypothetical protein
MSGCLGYLASCTPRKNLLICQLHYGKLLLVGPLRFEGSQAQCRAPSLLCVVGAVGLLLRVVPPTVELSLRPLIR